MYSAIQCKFLGVSGTGTLTHIQWEYSEAEANAKTENTNKFKLFRELQSTLKMVADIVVAKITTLMRH